MLDLFEAVGRALADRNRLRILKMLEPDELCVCQITAILGLAPATVSKHLSLLRLSGLLAHRREGRWVYYRLAPSQHNPYADKILTLLRGVLLDDATIEEDRRRLKVINAMSLQELLSLGQRAFSDTDQVGAVAASGR